MDRDTLARYQKMFNVTAEERDEIIRVLAEDESEAVGSMGDDTPMPVLSSKVRSLYDYFRQQFAQVTNPPIDPLRESIVMSLQTQIGPECNIFVPAPEHARQIVMNSPVLSQRKLRADPGAERSRASRTSSSTCSTSATRGLAGARSCASATRPKPRCAPASSCCCSPTGTWCRASSRCTRCSPPAPCITAWSKKGLRCKCNLLVETGTARDAHHFACLIGYGATAVYPYMAYQTLFDMMRKGRVKMDAHERLELGRSYRRGIIKGLLQDHVEDGYRRPSRAIAARSCSKSSASTTRW